MSSPTLYQHLLGDSYALLPDSLRRFHALSSGGIAHGVVAVEWPTGRIARGVARLLMLPGSGAVVPVRVVVQSEPWGELWSRWFNGTPMRTSQRARGGLLAERKGPATVYFNLHADAGGLHFQYHSTRMLGIPIPRFIAPTVTARAEGAGHGWKIHVQITIPLLGLIASYHGHIQPES